MFRMHVIHHFNIGVHYLTQFPNRFAVDEMLKNQDEDVQDPEELTMAEADESAGKEDDLSKVWLVD